MKFLNNPVYHSTLWAIGAEYDRVCTPETIMDASKGFLWPSCGNSDIAEADCGTVTTTRHCASNLETNNHVIGGNATLTSDASSWHIYGYEWTEDYIKVY